MNKWLDSPSDVEDVVVSSRIRLARNINNHKFPTKLTIDESDKLTDEVLNGLKESLLENYKFIRVRDLDHNLKMEYVENHLISPKLVKNGEKSSFLLRDDERVTIMLNEEDHLRIQVLSRGLNFEENWEILNEIDDTIDKNLEYAFDKKWGYLTSCPTNVGTGLRVSSMLHLPCLTQTGNMKSLIQGLAKIDITTRGFFGEGTNIIGNMYQISNQRTLGESEDEIIKKMEEIIYQVVSRERQTREYLKEHKRLDMEDKIYRSFGILKYAKKINIKEAMLHLSNIRLGIEMGLIDNINYETITKLMMDIQPYTIQNRNFDINDKSDIEIIRSNILKDFLNDMEG